MLIQDACVSLLITTIVLLVVYPGDSDPCWLVLATWLIQTNPDIEAAGYRIKLAASRESKIKPFESYILSFAAYI
jgi:hypothetical protein